MIHQYKNNGYNIVMDVNSGSVHVVDDCVYDVIPRIEECINNGVKEKEGILTALKAERSGEGQQSGKEQLSEKKLSYTEQELEEAVEEILELYEAGQLFTEDIYENYIGDFKNRQTVVKALCLHIAHDCNLACRYCFAEEGEYHGRRALMSFEVGKKALDFLVANSGSRVNLEVDFFGGEPLMNWQVVKDLVAYARSLEPIHNKNFRFTLTTNGVLLDDEVIDFCNEEMHNVVLSLDGRKEVHDRFRKDYAGNGSYDTIVPKFQHFVERRGDKSYYIRGTYTHYNTDFVNDILHMADLGFRNVSVEPVVGEETCGYALKDEDLPVVLEQYEKLAEKLKDRADVNFFHFNVDLAQGPCVIKRLRGCGAGCEYVAVTPEGDIYPCHQFVGNPAYKIGSLSDGSFDMELSHRFSCLNIYTREECRDCWARFYCSGGCSASNLLVNGDIKKPNHVGCEMERKRLECAIALKALAAGMG